MTMVWPMLARVDDATRDSHLAATVRAYRECAVTTAVDMALNSAAAATMARAEAAGTLDVRVIAHRLIHRSGDTADELAQVVRAAEMATRHTSDRFRIVGIKLIVDGTIDGCTAAMIDPLFDGSNACRGRRCSQARRTRYHGVDADGPHRSRHPRQVGTVLGATSALSAALPGPNSVTREQRWSSARIRRLRSTNRCRTCTSP